MGNEYDAAEAARYAEHHPDARFVLAEDYDELTTRRMETIAMSDMLTEELAAANDTLATLRLIVPPHGYWPLDDTAHDNITWKIHAILYTEGRNNG